MITQLSINNGENLFQTGYTDPPFVARERANTGYQRNQTAAAAAAGTNEDAKMGEE